MMNGSTPKEKENPIVTLRAQAEKFGFSRLRAGKDNAEANSGATMYVDLPRMKLVIQNKVITKSLLMNYIINIPTSFQMTKISTANL